MKASDLKPLTEHNPPQAMDTVPPMKSIVTRICATEKRLNELLLIAQQAESK